MGHGIDLLDDLFDLPDEAAPVNEALARWAAEHGANVPEMVEARPVRGPCSLCANKATLRCLRCERPVCVRHHHVMVGICTRCTEATGDEATPQEGPVDPYADERPPPRPELDLDWIE